MGKIRSGPSKDMSALLHCLPLWKTVLSVSSRAFLLSTPTFSTPVENNEATWKKATKWYENSNVTPLCSLVMFSRYGKRQKTILALCHQMLVDTFV